jgi:hypothetical protein
MGDRNHPAEWGCIGLELVGSFKGAKACKLDEVFSVVPVP